MQKRQVQHARNGSPPNSAIGVGRGSDEARVRGSNRPDSVGYLWFCTMVQSVSYLVKWVGMSVEVLKARHQAEDRRAQGRATRRPVGRSGKATPFRQRIIQVRIRRHRLGLMERYGRLSLPSPDVEVQERFFFFKASPCKSARGFFFPRNVDTPQLPRMWILTCGSLKEQGICSCRSREYSS